VVAKDEEWKKLNFKNVMYSKKKKTFKISLFPLKHEKKTLITFSMVCVCTCEGLAIRWKWNSCEVEIKERKTFLWTF